MRIGQDNLRANISRKSAAGVTRHRRGSVLIYSLFLMTIMLGFISFGVDYGHMQTIKTEMQRDADGVARGALQMYLTYGSSTAVAYAPLLATNTYNPVDANSGTPPTVTVTWGSWNSQTNVFTPGGSTPVAVKVVVSRSAVNNNPVKLTFPLMNGLTTVKRTCDVWAQAIAVLNGSSSSSGNVSGLSDLWLSGMANGSPAISDGDTAPAESPTMWINVIPGTTLTFSGPSGGTIPGGVKHDPAFSNDTADGDISGLYGHNSDWTSEPPVENNIGDIRAPIDAVIGTFLTNNSPDTQSAPTVVRDYSTQAARDQVNFSDIQLQQPFLIGNGETSTGTTQTFTVPPGATRLFLGTMDGHQWSNNSGSFSVKVTQQQTILLVK